MRFLICDDDVRIMAVLASMVQAVENVEIQTFSSCSALLGALEDLNGAVDAVFLDIVFEGDEGIETANRIRSMYPRVKIVFITGHIEYAPDIFDAAPVYLLKKPFQIERVASAVEIIRGLAQKEAENTITFRTGGGLRTVEAAAIEYVESDRRRIIITGDFDTFECYGKLSELEKSLPEYFSRCHQSFVVNMNRIRRLGGNEVTMASGSVIPVAQRRRNAFKEDFVTHVALLGENVD